MNTAMSGPGRHRAGRTIHSFPSTDNGGTDVRFPAHEHQRTGVRTDRHRGVHRQVRSRALAPVAAPSLTVIVPAYNEEEGLSATLDALLRQTVPCDEIIVVDDGSADRTAEIARRYGVTVLQPPANLGTKARAQNYALPYCRTELVLAVDADTVLSDDYVEQIKPAFADPKVTIAAGAVRTRFQKTLWERGREIEYLAGFHWYRPIQNMVSAPAVCSGCCSAFRLRELTEFGGFPERTMVEDMDYTWSTQISGYRALYVPGAVAYAAEPTSFRYLRKQLWRWKSGWFQNVRLHYLTALRRKPMLALWMSMSLIDIAISPLTLALPVLWLTVFHKTLRWVLLFAGGSEVVVMGPALVVASVKRKISFRRIAACYPSYYALKFINAFYDWKAMAVELVGVPLGLTSGLATYEKGRAEGPRQAAPRVLAGDVRSYV
jgi:cellulose synthase/poly-beta-1,6-N-acetylglucosamine synthase-like glycosyltransferase